MFIILKSMIATHQHRCTDCGACSTPNSHLSREVPSIAHADHSNAHRCFDQALNIITISTLKTPCENPLMKHVGTYDL